MIYYLAHQNRTIAIASDFRVDGAKIARNPAERTGLGPGIAALNRESLATFHRTLKSQCSIAFFLSRKSLRFLGSAMGIRNRKHRKNRCDFGALRFTTSSVFLYRQDPLGTGKGPPKTDRNLGNAFSAVLIS